MRSLKLRVWPKEVSEVTEVKMKKILGENSKIVNFWRYIPLGFTYPAAQDPAVVPPFDSHSFAVKQVPFLKRLPVPPLEEKSNCLTPTGCLIWI